MFVIDGEEYEEVEEQLRKAKDYIEHIQGNPPEQRARYGSTGDEESTGPPGPPFGIVINGHSLVSDGVVFWMSVGLIRMLAQSLPTNALLAVFYSGMV